MMAANLRRAFLPLVDILAPTLMRGCASTSACTSTFRPALQHTTRHFSSSRLVRKDDKTSENTETPPVSQGGSYCLAIANVPRLAHTEDIFKFMSGPNITFAKEDIRLSYTDKFVRRNWYLKFNDEKSFQLAKAKSGQHLGTRPVRLATVPTQEWFQAGHPRPGAQRNCSVLIGGVPEEATMEDIEKFFRGYRLGTFPINTFYTEVAGSTYGRPTGKPTMKKRAFKQLLEVERHAIVRLISEEEAWRAHRNKHQQFLLNQKVDVSFL